MTTVTLTEIPFHIEVQVELVIAYLLLSVYASLILIYDDMDDGKVITKSIITKHMLKAFTPGFNVIITFFWTLFKVIELVGKIGCKESAIDRQEERDKHVFGFLKYKNIDLSELDDYIESRSLLEKMTDKLQ